MVHDIPLNQLLHGHYLPKLIVFDLDYTLWPLWIDTHVSAPFISSSSDPSTVLDGSKRKIQFFKHVPEILSFLQDQNDVQIALASRTFAPDDAMECLSLMKLPKNDGTHDTAISFFDHLEIYPGSKINHFKSLNKKTGIPFHDMLFFDDEFRNSEVHTHLGVTFIHVDENDGVDKITFLKGLKEWDKRRIQMNSSEIS